MTAAVFRNTPSLSIPQSQNTAPVLEFNCLFTHDVRKKQRKWHDGFLRFHTFNKRVMVYDVPRNFIGDMHWTGDEEIQEGDELTLERSGVKVEVAESIGRTETDLSELRKSRKKETSTVKSPASSKAASTPLPRPATAGAPRPGAQLKHRSLNALLGTPKGPIGKAVLPTRSPFEERHAEVENEEWEDGRPPKRAKTSSAPAWNVTRTTKTPVPVKQSETPLWARKADAAKQKRKAVLPAGQQQLGTKEIIDLCEDAEEGEQSHDFLPGLSDDALAPSSSPGRARRGYENRDPRDSSPTCERVANVPKRHAEQSLEQVGRKLEQDVAVVNVRYGDRDKSASPIAKTRCAMPPPSRPPMEPSKNSTKSQRPSDSNAGQALRLAASGPRRRTLLCQNQLTKMSQKATPPKTKFTVEDRPAPKKDTSPDPPPSAARQKLQARLARIRQKGASTGKQEPGRSTAEQLQKRPPPAEDERNSVDDETLDTSETLGDENEGFEQIVTSHEASAMELRRLDDLMLPPAVPPMPRARPTKGKPPSPKPARATAERPLRRSGTDPDAMLNSTSRRIPGAPVRYTPSPTKRSRESTPASDVGSRPSTPTVEKPPGVRPVSRPQSKKRQSLQKSVSLNVTSGGTSAVILSKPFQAPGKADARWKNKEVEVAPKDVGPWSRDAFDLFTWRPPGWDEEKWCVTEADNSDRSNSAGPSKAPPGLSGGVSMSLK